MEYVKNLLGKEGEEDNIGVTLLEEFLKPYIIDF